MSAVARPSASSTAAASKPGWKIIDPPDSSTTLVATNRPCVWKMGRACTSTSSAVNRQHSTSASAFERRLSWVSMAPLERPVVPDV